MHTISSSLYSSSNQKSTEETNSPNTNPCYSISTSENNLENTLDHTVDDHEIHHKTDIFRFYLKHFIENVRSMLVERECVWRVRTQWWAGRRSPGWWNQPAGNSARIVPFLWLWATQRQNHRQKEVEGHAGLTEAVRNWKTARTGLMTLQTTTTNIPAQQYYPVQLGPALRGPRYHKWTGYHSLRTIVAFVLSKLTFGLLEPT